jgi:uncharacterized phage protein (TIGR02218 family)
VRVTPSALVTHRSLGTTSMATCWRVTRQDAQVFGFTDHDRNLTVDGVRYLAGTGFLPSAIETQSRLASDNQSMLGFLNGESIVAADLAAGVWDYAEIFVFQVNWRDTSQGIDIKERGRIGEITLQRGVFQAEFRGLANAYGQAINEVYQAGCRAQLGDDRCTVDLVPWTVTGTVDAVSASGLTVTDAARTEAAGYFEGGKITMLDGPSEGLSIEVKSSVVGSFVLQLQFSRGIEAGNSYSMHAGCSKRFDEDCVARFANGNNFRGEPHIPGTDQLIRFGGQ